MTHRFIDRSISNISDFSFDSRAGDDEKAQAATPLALATIQEASSDAESVAVPPARSTPPSDSRDNYNSSAANAFISADLLSSPIVPPISSAMHTSDPVSVRQNAQRRYGVTSRPVSEARTPTKPAFQVHTSKASTPQSASKRNGLPAASRSADKNSVPVATVSLSLHKSHNSRLASTSKFANSKS